MPRRGDERRLAAIMFTDIVGSTSATARSERDGLALRERHRQLVHRFVSRYGGRVIESPGDETLSVFESALGAVGAAFAIQAALRDTPDLRLSIGLHLGETVFRGNEVFGDAVNLAARVRALAGPGEILASAELVHSIRGQPEISAEPRGEHELKNVGRPVAVFALSGEASVPMGPRRGTRTRVLAALAAMAILAAATGIWQLREIEYFWSNPLDGARVERLTDFPGDEWDAAISPDGRFVVFLANRDGRFDAWISQVGSGEFLDLTKGQFGGNPDTAGTAVRPVGFSFDGSEAWILEVSSGGRGEATWKVPTLGGALHPFLRGGVELAWSPDGERLAYHTTDLGDPVFVADATGANARKLFAQAPGGHSHFLSWSPDGRFLYFVGGTPSTSESDIWRVPVAASEGPVEPERITRHDARIAHLAWLDARTLVYSATAEDGSGEWLYAIDVERRRPHRISGGIAEQYLSVALSSGTPRRMVVTLANPHVTVWSVPLSARIQREDAATPLAVPNARAASPRFTSDGMLFLSSRGGPDGLWKLSGGTTRELWQSADGGVVAPPAVSRDGSVIALSVRAAGRTSLRLIDADGTGTRTLAESLDVRGAASWSPDGQWLAVAARQGERTRLFKIPAAGGRPVVLVETPAYHPLWSPDGRFIVYSEPLRGAFLALRAITPAGTAVPIPEISVPYVTGTPFRFTPDGRALVHLVGVSRHRNFVRVDLATSESRQLTDFGDALIQSFDIAPDGKAIVFDRRRDNADIVVMDLAESR